MKKVKILFWILIFAIVVLFIFQNQSLFLNKQTIRINLHFASYELPDLPNVIILMACFLIGLLLSYFFNLSERYRSKKMVKKMNETIGSLQQEISGLQASEKPPKDPVDAEMEKENQAA